MDVIAGRFMDLGSAIAARDAILASVAVPPADVAVRPLGTTRYDEPIEAFVLGGRVPTAATDHVARLIREHRGTILARRTEWQPKPRMQGSVSKHRPLTPRPGAPRLRAGARRRPRRPAARCSPRTTRCRG